MISCAVCHRALLPGEVMTRRVLTVFGNSKVQHVCSSCHAGTRSLLKGRKGK
jgi:RNase P subunit RPR2